MKKFIFLIILSIILITGCGRQKQPDEYYIDLFKEETGYGSSNNLLCSVNTISDSQVKVTCRYDVKGVCLSWSRRAYAGCEQYEIKTKTSERIYDIEYKD